MSQDFCARQKYTAGFVLPKTVSKAGTVLHVLLCEMRFTTAAAFRTDYCGRRRVPHLAHMHSLTALSLMRP